MALREVALKELLNRLMFIMYPHNMSIKPINGSKFPTSNFKFLNLPYIAQIPDILSFASLFHLEFAEGVWRYL